MESVSEIKTSAIDHLGVVGRDITAMVAAYIRLGFAPTEPVSLMGVADDEPAPLGQDSAHLIFADSYVELSGVTSSDPAHHLAPFLKRRNGLHILAFRCDDADNAHDQLLAQGLDVPAVQGASRTVTYGSRHGDAQFKWFKAPDSLSDEGFVCLVEQVTPALVFQPPASGHPNGALSVTGVTILTEDPVAATTQYSAYQGAHPLGGNQVDFDGQRLIFLNQTSFAQQFEVLPDLIPPAFAGFTVRVEDMDTTRGILSENSVPLHEGTSGEIWVSPSDACGSLLIFSPT
ncbi:MAG: VOC family protein [Rhodospirillaceae bacterium]|nr:VOC family protein [Rhodospirillaceae bacterium]